MTVDIAVQEALPTAAPERRQVDVPALAPEKKKVRVAIDPVTGNYVYNVGNLEREINRQAKGESSWAAQFTIRYEF